MPRKRTTTEWNTPAKARKARREAERAAELTALLTKIAVEHLLVDETLETRRSDGLDFHDNAVWSIKSALEAAYAAGLKAGSK
jgi:hypothetical protein